MVFTTKFTHEEYKKWFEVYLKMETSGFNFKVSPYWYFEPRPMIVTSITSLMTIGLFFTFLFTNPLLLLLLIPTLFFSWGQIFIRLPFDSGKGNTAEYPEYGLCFYSVDGEFPSELYIRKGKKSYFKKLPWGLNWFRTSYIKIGGSWEHETKGNPQQFWDEDRWGGTIWSEKYPYTYTLKSGEKQERTATLKVVEREWRRSWLTFTSLFNLVDKKIDIEFDQEVGERTGSWKGGCTGCSYSMKKNETPLECLRRMEKERIFK